MSITITDKEFESSMDPASGDTILSPQQFGALADTVIRRLQRSMEEVGERRLTCHVPAADVVAGLREQPVPEVGADPQEVVAAALDLMLEHSLFVAHPRFLGYVCPAADPMGVLADTIVAAVNPNAASAMMAPIGHEIERTVIRWLAQLIGLPDDADGILLSGGNEANLVGLLAAREHRTPWPIREFGFDHPGARPLCVYATEEVHNGMHKAVEIAGIGRNGLHIVPMDRDQRMDVGALRELIRKDRSRGSIPICVVASAGTIATGVIDPLADIVEVAAEEDVWVHVDGSYGAAAALLADAPEDLRTLGRVDSVSWDPHKWLRVPYEAGCVLLRRPDALSRTFGLRPSYYKFGDYANVTHYYEKGPQNSRHLRALKVWMSLRQHGRRGHAAHIARDIELTGEFFKVVQQTPTLEAWTCNLCVATFRYVPAELRDQTADAAHRERLNTLNQRIIDRVQEGGDSYLSNAVVDGHFLLRACFVNYRTRPQDIRHVVELVCRLGHEMSSTC
jgi:glutamate/tyrosine decarboxylase-like PLP-dependent enzyme